MVLGRKTVHQTMISVNKLGRLALSKLAKKLDASVEFCTEEIPFDKFFKSSKSEFHPAFMCVSYRVFLWDWEFGLLEATSQITDLGYSILGALGERVIDKKNTPPSHLAIYEYTCQDSGDGYPTESKELKIYRFSFDKLNEWLEVDEMTKEQYYARPEHHR